MRIHVLVVLGLALANLQNPLRSESLDTVERFTIIKKIDSTPIKNQYKTNTCWSYAGVAFLESELIKQGRGEINLSSMYVVHQVYIQKADKYVRFHGMNSFTGGGALFDVLNVISNYGMIPEESYSGLKDGSTLPDHFTMDIVLKDYVDALIKNKKIPTAWKEGFIGILDAYMNKVPESFTYKGKAYTPRSFADFLNINPDDFILLSSFQYKPYYSQFIVEVPDNWSQGMAYNVKLEEMMSTIDNSINNGHTVAITIDDTETGFKWKEGIALATHNPEEDNTTLASAVWLPKKDTLPQVIQEVVVTPEIRQQAFDNYETTDDHSLLLIGFAKDQKGKKFYIAKNSWGTFGTPYDGYLYLSEAYIKYKTLTVLVNKSMVTNEIMKKINPESKKK